jgi:large subunit ribosomal protein L9
MQQVILLEKVVNLGDLGEIVRVRDGYARNFLIPRKIAKRATPAAIEEFNARKAELEKAQAEKLAAAQGLGERLTGYQLKLTQKAGVDGRLFGSVTNADISEGLRKAGFDKVEKAHVRLPDGPLKAIGEYPIQVALHPDVVSEITVLVEGEIA